jgi:PAS domain S-box-containing protein
MNEQGWSAETRAKRRILVVDDDRDFADTLARLLDLEGYEVQCTYSIAAAQAELERFPAEVALIDIRMGERSGLSLVSALHQRRPEIICIMMTAYSSIQTAIEALQEGAYDYLRKPFYSEHLMATLRRCFERIALAQAREQAESALRQRNRELEELNRRLEQTESALRQRNRELEGLNARLQRSVRSMRTLAAFASLCELSAAVLEEVAGNTEAQGGVVYLRETGRLAPRYSFGSGGPGTELSAGEAEALCRAVAHDGAAVEPWSEQDRLAFPLTGEAREPIGLVVVEAGPERAFTQQDREIGEILVSFAGESIRLVQALESLASSEERLRDVIDNSPSSISLKDLEGRFVIVNKRFEEWYGHGQAEAAGKTSRDIFPEEIARLYAAQWEEVLNSQKVVEEEIEVPFADGKPHVVLVTKFPVLGATGRPTGVGTIATDVTDSRRAEEQLRQAQKTEALGQLTGGIAHDFNNLLAVISGNLDLMKDELAAVPDLAELLEDALSSAQSGAELTHRLLAFGRRQTLHPQVTDAGELVKGMSRMLERALGETIETRWVLNEGLWPVEVDRNQLETSLLNLVINARDAMAESGVLTIETANATLGRGDALAQDATVPGDYVVVSVTDSGTGMAPEIVEKAIQPFFTTKEVGHGSGLGLSMVYGFVKQSGGHLEIASSTGQGTAVRLYLPKAETEAREGEAQAPGPAATGGSGERILVVEDKADVRRLATRILTRLGYEVLEAADGKSALESLAAGPKVDLLFTDVVLPGRISGADLAKEAQARHPELKVLYTSGYANNAALEDGSSRDEVRFIKKPFAKEGLARMVRRALERAPRRADQSGEGSGVNI